jgi:GxxExxY protein
LAIRNLNFVSELVVEVSYKGVDVNADLRCDFLVEDVVVVELKAIDILAPIHEAQILTYMKLLQKPKGLLINFNSTNIQENGYKAFVNEYYKNLIET